VLVGFVGFCYSCFIRTELSVIGVGILFSDYQVYNSLVTTHGLAMLLGFIMPLSLGAITNYFLPVFLGIPDLLFSRINNLSF
jgi:cytochrome c oxidase subunit 1